QPNARTENRLEAADHNARLDPLRRPLRQRAGRGTCGSADGRTADITCRCTANDRAGCSAPSSALTNWRVTRAENERAQRNKRNNREKVLFHKLFMSVNSTSPIERGCALC